MASLLFSWASRLAGLENIHQAARPRKSVRRAPPHEGDALTPPAVRKAAPDENVSTFSKVFKRRAPMTPREYRAKFGLRS